MLTTTVPPPPSNHDLNLATGPEPAVVAKLARIWADALGVDQVGPQDDFFESGGDSFEAAGLAVAIEKAFGTRLPLSVLLEGATPERVAALLQVLKASAYSSLVALQPHGSRPPFYLVHGIGGELLSFGPLARAWSLGQPLYGLRVRYSDGSPLPFDSVEGAAAHYVAEVRAHQPAGPYALGGYSFGGVVAYEMARQLTAQGQAVPLLAILDTNPHFPPRRGPRSLGGLWRFLANLPRWALEDVVRAGPGTVTRRVRAWVAERTGALGNERLAAASLIGASNLPGPFADIVEAHLRARRRYRPLKYPGRLTLFRAWARPLLSGHERDLGWGELAAGGVAVRDVPGNHLSLLADRHVGRLAASLLAELEQTGPR